MHDGISVARCVESKRLFDALCFLIMVKSAAAVWMHAFCDCQLLWCYLLLTSALNPC